MRKQTIVFIFIHVFLAIQIALPLHYYTARRDRNDERFAWRMFSPVRMLRCQPVFRVGESQEPLRSPGSVFHEAWLELAKRGRLAVVTAMARELCARHPGQPVRAELACTTVKDEKQTLGGGWDLCTLESP